MMVLAVRAFCARSRGFLDYKVGEFDIGQSAKDNIFICGGSV